MRNKFDLQLELLNREMVEMGAMCEYALAIIADILQNGKAERIAEIDQVEEQIDHMESSIEQHCMRLLLQQQPVARDLRLISAALKMITDMERIGDQTHDIAEILSYETIMQGEKGGSRNDNLLKMVQTVGKMVTGAIDAYVRKDMVLVEEVMQMDDIVDDLFDLERQTLIQEIAENPLNGELVMDQLMIAKYFERLGDHAVNIAEWVRYSITGKHERLDEETLLKLQHQLCN